MARSVLCPVHFLFFVLRAGGHNGVQLGILREAVNKRDGGVPEEQQPFAGIGMGHIGKLVWADIQLIRQNLTVTGCLIQHINEVAVLKNVRHFAGRKQIVG